MEYKILNTLDKEWGEILKETKFADIYFTPEYSKIYEKNYSSEINNSFGGKSFLFFSGNKKDFLIVPLIKRKINDLDFIQDKKLPEYFDLISPYGYAGPIIKTTNEKKPHPLLDEIKFITSTEGKCVQMLHLGSYDSEKESFDIMEKYCFENNLKRISKIHREIYLSDARKTAPEKLKTVLRFNVE